MKYNSQRDMLILPQYGRTMQDMVNYCCQLEDRAERQACAETIIGIMANINPAVKQQADYQTKLWHQLAMLSNFQLDIDYPVEIPTPTELAEKPRRVPYPMQTIKRRHYGHITESLLQLVGQMPDDEERKELTGVVANCMKRGLYNWNIDAMDDSKIRADISDYTDGRVELPADARLVYISGPRASEEQNKRKRKKK